MSDIHVIGINYPLRLDVKTRAILDKAGVILASRRLFDIFSAPEETKALREKCRVINKIDDTISYLKRRINQKKDAVVLASGDPLFFGIGKRLLKEFPKKNVTLYPAISSIQMAFARIKEPWDDAFFVSLHGHGRRPWSMEDLPLLCELHGKLLILTGGRNTPSTITGALPPDTKVYVLEKLDYADERVRSGSPAEIKRMRFREPNLMIAISPSAECAAFGLSENEFRHQKGLITKDEIRAVVLHKLRLPREGVLWDIGAGSGSVSIEAKRLSPDIDVYAIERSAPLSKLIKSNINNLNAGGVYIVKGEAPDVLKKLPDPDRVFIGGSGTKPGRIIAAVSRRLRKGIIVMTAITLESLGEATDELKRLGFEPEVISISVSRASDLKGRSYLKALNPVFIIRGVR